MKCPDCGGTGVIHFRNIHVLCGKCQGIGFIDDEPKPKKQMTEQEYIQSCNHKELTEILFRMIMHGSVIRPDRQYISKWLKRPHEE